MATRREFLQQIWDEIINGWEKGHWIENQINLPEDQKTGPWGDIGAIVERLLAAGASREDLSRLMSFSSYEATFGLLYLMDDPGLDEGDVPSLRDDLLIADPSGREGRPG